MLNPPFLGRSWNPALKSAAELLGKLLATDRKGPQRGASPAGEPAGQLIPELVVPQRVSQGWQPRAGSQAVPSSAPGHER